MSNTVKRIISEKGIILALEYKEATKGYAEKNIAPRPERYLAKIITCPEYSTAKGFLDCSMLDYTITKEEYDKLTPHTKVSARFEFTSYKLVPLGFEVIK